MAKIPIGVVGVGKIARDQHLPVLRLSDDFELVAAVSRHGEVDGLPTYRTPETMLAAIPGIRAAAICTPPEDRHALARTLLENGRHVLLEKPPAATVAQVDELVALAARRGLALFAAWHAREAAAVAPATDWLRHRVIRKVEIVWREDVRRWHPGQDWIWRDGAPGVFDPGINALSILTRLVPGAVRLIAADLALPSNRLAPIAARLELTTASGAPILATFDWRATAEPVWTIRVVTDTGTLLLADGGATMRVSGEAFAAGPVAEYERLYRRFAALIVERRVDVDLAPLRLMADAFRIGQHTTVAAFEDEAR